MMEIEKNFNLIKILSVFFIWFIYHSIYLVLIQKELTAWAGYFPLIAQVGLDIAVVYLSFIFHKNENCTKQKSIHLLFFLSALSAMCADFIYHGTMNIIDENYFNIANSLFEIPFILFLFFQVLCWKNIFFMDAEKIQGKKHYLPYITLASLIFFVFVCVFPWKISYFSKLGIYQLTDTVLEGIGFVLAALCLARSQNNPVRFLSIGYLLIISSDILIRHDVISGLIPSYNPFETTWSLGLLLMCMGFSGVRNKKIELLPLNSLQSHIAIWLLNLFLLFVFLFISLNYLFPQKIHLSSFIIPSTILAIICSKYFASKILAPHKRLEIIIKNFLENNEKKYLEEEKRTSTTINDFIVLEKFIYDAFDMYKKNHHIEIEYARMATQVAHDIQSPLLALNNYIQEAIKLSPDTYHIVEASINRINEIANNLLLQHKKKVDYPPTIEPELIEYFLRELVEEKRMEFNGKAAKIKLSIHEDLYNCFVSFNVESFRRTVSNLLNNAAESIVDDPLIQVSLYKCLNTLILEIKDNGSGIPDDVISNINKGYPNKHFKGNGLGLPYALKSIQEWGAEYQIETCKKDGTRLKIIFRQQDVPPWIQNEIYLYDNLHVVIVDDDYSMHTIWKNLILNANKNIRITCLQNPSEFSALYKDIDAENTLFLIDYHFINSDLTGMALIKKMTIKNAIIISNKYPDNTLKAFLMTNKAHFLLKKNLYHTRIINLSSKPDLILIDDKKLVTEIWRLEANKCNKNICTFNHGTTFMKYVNLFDKHTPIYLDFLLENEDSEQISKSLYDSGFNNIYITTGFDSSKINKFPWIKGIINKSPPYKKSKNNE